MSSGRVLRLRDASRNSEIIKGLTALGLWDVYFTVARSRRMVRRDVGKVPALTRCGRRWLLGSAV